MIQILKYPRTQHIEGSRLQHGDHDLSQVPFSDLKGKHLIVEEKVDGSNTGISFSENGELLLQSRGHYLTGGPRERHFAMFKTWGYTYMQDLYAVLGDRYIMYGEWLYAKHTVFYTDLTHYFMEFDIYDKEKEVFLSTEKRREFHELLPCIMPVKVLYEGQLKKLAELTDFVQQSHFIRENHMEVLAEICEQQGLKTELILAETDPSIDMEGLYIKVEENGIVTERYKWVRHDFHARIMSSNSHWLDRPIIANGLAEGIDIFKS